MKAARSWSGGRSGTQTAGGGPGRCTLTPLVCPVSLLLPLSLTMHGSPLGQWGCHVHENGQSALVTLRVYQATCHHCSRSICGRQSSTAARLSVHCRREGRLELDIIWDQVPAASAVRTEPLNPGSASEWRMHVIDPAHAQPYGHSVFSLSVSTNIWLDTVLRAFNVYLEQGVLSHHLHTKFGTVCN